MTNPADEAMEGFVDIDSRKTIKLSLLNAVLAVMPKERKCFECTIPYASCGCGHWNAAIAEMTDKVTKLFTYGGER